MKTILKIAGLVLVAMYFTACSHFPSIGDEPMRMTPERARAEGQRYAKDMPFWDKVKDTWTDPKFLNAKPVDDVIEVRIVGPNNR